MPCSFLFFFIIIFLFVFISCCIYSWAVSFCFFSFLWDVFFFCAASSSGLGTIGCFSVGSFQCMAGRAHVRVDPAMGSVSSAPHLGSFIHLDVLNDQRVHI